MIEHRREIYITSTHVVRHGKSERTCLVLMCARCGDRMITAGFRVSDVIAATDAHIERTADGG